MKRNFRIHIGLETHFGPESRHLTEVVDLIEFDCWEGVDATDEEFGGTDNAESEQEPQPQPNEEDDSDEDEEGENSEGSAGNEEAAGEPETDPDAETETGDGTADGAENGFGSGSGPEPGTEHEGDDGDDGDDGPELETDSAPDLVQPENGPENSNPDDFDDGDFDSTEADEESEPEPEIGDGTEVEIDSSSSNSVSAQSGIEGGNPFDGIRGLSRTETDSSIDIHREFDSWYDFVTCADNESLRQWTNRRSSHQPERENGFYGTESFAQAVDMALNSGWPEGRKLLQKLQTSVPETRSERRSFNFDVAGMFPIVPLYNAGDPSCMAYDDYVDVNMRNKVIRIDFNHGTHGRCPSSAIMQRGAAVVSLAQSLEEMGHSTELRVIENCCGRTWLSSKRMVFRVSVIYKRAGEYLDLDRAAFAIAHPSCLRRFNFAIMEQHAEIEPALGSNYGSPMFAPNDSTSGLPGGAVFIPNTHGTETFEQTQAAIQKATQHLFGRKP